MKYLLVLFGLIAISSALTLKENALIASLAKGCRLSSGIEPKILKGLKDGHDDDPTIKSFFFCIYKQLKFQRTDGTIDVDTLKLNFPTGIPENERQAIFDNCLNVKGVDGEDTAYLLYKCSISKISNPPYELLM